MASTFAQEPGTTVAIRYSLVEVTRRMTDAFPSDWLVPGSAGGSHVADCASTEAFGAYDAADERHRTVELCLCVRGTMCVKIGERYIHLADGEAAVVPPLSPHEERAYRGRTYECIWITTDPYMAYLHSSGRNGAGFYTGEAIAAGPDTGLDVSAAELARLTEISSFSYVTLMKTHVLQLLIGIIDDLPADARPDSKAPAVRDTAVRDTAVPAMRRPSHTVVRVLNYIKRNHTRKIRLAEIADELCMSPSHLNALFKRERGETVMQNLEAYRIAVARKLLTHTENTVEQIASHLAFCDQFHFSKTFKKQTGVSPMQYRLTKPRNRE